MWFLIGTTSMSVHEAALTTKRAAQNGQFALAGALTLTLPVVAALGALGRLVAAGVSVGESRF